MRKAWIYENWQLVAPFVRVTEPFLKKISREPRSELLKPLLFIAELCRRNKKKDRT